MHGKNAALCMDLAGDFVCVCGPVEFASSPCLCAFACIVLAWGMHILLVVGCVKLELASCRSCVIAMSSFSMCFWFCVYLGISLALALNGPL